MIVIIPHNSHVLHSGTLNNCVFPIITKNVFIKLNTRVLAILMPHETWSLTISPLSNELFHNMYYATYF